MGHGVAVGAQGHWVRLEIYLSLRSGEGPIHRQFIVMCQYGEPRDDITLLTLRRSASLS